MIQKLVFKIFYARRQNLSIALILFILSLFFILEELSFMQTIFKESIPSCMQTKNIAYWIPLNDSVKVQESLNKISSLKGIKAEPLFLAEKEIVLLGKQETVQVFGINKESALFFPERFIKGKKEVLKEENTCIIDSQSLYHLRMSKAIKNTLSIDGHSFKIGAIWDKQKRLSSRIEIYLPYEETHKQFMGSYWMGIKLLPYACEKDILHKIESNIKSKIYGDKELSLFFFKKYFKERKFTLPIFFGLGLGSLFSLLILALGMGIFFRAQREYVPIFLMSGAGSMTLFQLIVVPMFIFLLAAYALSYGIALLFYVPDILSVVLTGLIVLLFGISASVISILLFAFKKGVYE